MYAIIKDNTHYQASTKNDLIQCIYSIDIKTQKDYSKHVYINGKLDSITYSNDWSYDEVRRETIKRCIKLLQREGWIFYKSV